MPTLRTTVSIAHSDDIETHAIRVLHATDVAERDLTRRADLQGLELAASPVVVDQENGIVDYDANGVPFVRSVRTMTDDEVAEWTVEHRLAVPPLLILTFQADVLVASPVAA
jgi:hypothetical protein